MEKKRIKVNFLIIILEIIVFKAHLFNVIIIEINVFIKKVVINLKRVKENIMELLKVLEIKVSVNFKNFKVIVVD